MQNQFNLILLSATTSPFRYCTISGSVIAFFFFFVVVQTGDRLFKLLYELNLTAVVWVMIVEEGAVEQDRSPHRLLKAIKKVAGSF